MNQASVQSASTDAFLRVANVRKSYDGTTNVVEGVTLDITKGEFVTFLGPSGSGKTTMLSMIAGFEAPSGGDIRLNGRSLVEVPVNKRNIGIVFQNYALFPHMSALDNVAFPLQMRKLPSAETAEKARQALATVGLEQHANKLPRQLSGGQQQRVALARALVFKPDVLLLDEPLSALDKNLRVQMQIEIKRLHQEMGMTTVFVTHDQSEAMTMSDRIAVFSHGRIEQFGSPMEIYSKPATRFVGSFIGESNFFDVTVADTAQGLYRSEQLGMLEGPKSPSFALGAACSLMVRPESIRLVPSGATATPGSCRAEFDVQTIINYGDSALVIGQANGLAVRVKLPQIDLAGLAQGQRRSIVWEAQHSHALPAV